MSKFIYEPREDSIMLERYVREYAKGSVLDVGTGSGIQAIAAAQNKNVISVLAIDLQKDAIDYCKGRIDNKKIKFLQSDLFENIKKKFDTVIFNPPYLPQELKVKDLTIEGGRKGYELIEKFINEVNKFLNQDGIVLMVFSSLTKKEKVEEFIKSNLLDFKELEKAHIFFEDIYVYLLRKNELLKKLESKGIKNVKYMAKGHRGMLFAGIYKNSKVAVKTKNPESAAIGRIDNEIRWLKRLNRYKIAPEVLIVGNEYFVYKFIDGEFIGDYIIKANKNLIKKIIKNIFNRMFIFDRLGVDKEEMHHPLKHIIVAKDKSFLIDFERAHFTKNPKNVTQFCQFIMSGFVNKIFIDKKIKIDRGKIIKLAKVYKKEKSLSNLKKILKFF